MNLSMNYIISQINISTLGLIILCFIEIFSRTIKTSKKNKINKNFLVIEVSKKFLLLTIVFIGYLLDYYILSSNGNIRDFLTLFYLSSESLSIIDNCKSLGIPVPDSLKTILTKIKRKSNGE